MLRVGGGILRIHGRIFRVHGRILRVHGRVLRVYGRILRVHGGILRVRGRILRVLRGRCGIGVLTTPASATAAWRIRIIRILRLIGGLYRGILIAVVAQNDNLTAVFRGGRPLHIGVIAVVVQAVSFTIDGIVVVIGVLVSAVRLPILELSHISPLMDGAQGGGDSLDLAGPLKDIGMALVVAAQGTGKRGGSLRGRIDLCGLSREQIILSGLVGFGLLGGVILPGIIGSGLLGGVILPGIIGSGLLDEATLLGLVVSGLRSGVIVLRLLSGVVVLRLLDGVIVPGMLDGVVVPGPLGGVIVPGLLGGVVVPGLLSGVSFPGDVGSGLRILLALIFGILLLAALILQRFLEIVLVDNLVGAGGHRRVGLPVVAQDDDLVAFLCGDDMVGVAVGLVMPVGRFAAVDNAVQLHQRVGVVLAQGAVAGALVVGISKLLSLVLITLGRELRHRCNSLAVSGPVGHIQLAMHACDHLAAAFPVVAVLIPEVVHMDVVVGAPLFLRQHPVVAQDDDLGFLRIHSDFPCCGQTIIHMVIDRPLRVLLGTRVRCAQAVCTAIGLQRLIHIAIAVVCRHIVVVVGLAADGKGPFLGNVHRVIELIRFGPSAHGGDGAAPLVGIGGAIAVRIGVPDVILVDVAVAQGALGEHVGEGDRGGLAGGNLRFYLAAVAAHQLKDLGHIVRGGDLVLARREGDGSATSSRLEGHGLRLKAAVSPDFFHREVIIPAAVRSGIAILCYGQIAIAHDGEFKLLPRLVGAEGVAGDFHFEAVRLIQVYRLPDQVAARRQALDLLGLVRI